MDRFWKKGLLSALGLALGYQGARIIGRHLFKDTSRSALKTMMTDLYDENIWELVSATTRFSPQIIVETNLRSEEGKLIQRPL